MYDTIIIGGGPAGLTAGIYAGRRSLKTLLVSRDIGGQAAKTFDIENYPGSDKVTGPELTQKFLAQAKKFGTEIKYEEVKKITPENDAFIVNTSSGDHQAKTIILASGKQPRELQVPGEEEFKGRGISYCATCDAPFFKNKTVAVIGGGNSALDAALLASKICQKVFLIHRKSDFTAENILVEKVKKSEKIELILSVNIKQFEGKEKLEQVVLDNGKTIKIDGAIIEIGYIVDRSLFENLVETTESGQIVIDNKQATSATGIFAAGDLTTTPFKQIVISAAEGAKAALSAYDYIQKQSGKRGIVADWH